MAKLTCVVLHSLAIWFMCAVQQSGSPVSGPLLPKWPVQRSCPSPKRVSVLTSSLIKPTYAATELAFAQKNRATKRAVSPDMKAPRLEQPVALIPRKRGISCAREHIALTA